MFKLLAKILIRAAAAAAVAAATAAAKKALEKKPEPPEVDNNPPEVDNPPAPPRKAFDISNFWGLPQVFDRARAAMQQALREGYSGVIIGVVRHALGLAQFQQQVARSAGLWNDVYVYLRFDGEDGDRIRAALQVPGGIYWVDCEFRGDEHSNAVNEMSQDEINWHIWRACMDVWDAGMTAGIYSQKSWWEPYTGNNPWFAQSGLPLWDANDIEFKPYGGWTRPLWTQHTWDVQLAGMNVDLNVEGPNGN